MILHNILTSHQMLVLVNFYFIFLGMLIGYLLYLAMPTIYHVCCQIISSIPQRIRYGRDFVTYIQIYKFANNQILQGDEVLDKFEEDLLYFDCPQAQLDHLATMAVCKSYKEYCETTERIKQDDLLDTVEKDEKMKAAKEWFITSSRWELGFYLEQFTPVWIDHVLAE